MELNDTLDKMKILFMSQEIVPYVSESVMATVCRLLPQGIQEKDREVRTFMPRYGIVNERRNQLHEVVRLSGMNLIINDTDHPIIIKVASISQVRLQIYFIESEEYFYRKAKCLDNDGKMFDDNDERSVFFFRSVLETVKKLSWSPNILNCHGWMSALAPIYVNKLYRNNPLFTDIKIITTIYNDEFPDKFNNSLYDILFFDGINAKEIKPPLHLSYLDVMKCAIDNSDAVIFAEKNINPKLIDYVYDKQLPFITYNKYDIDYLTKVTDQFFEEIAKKN